MNIDYLCQLAHIELNPKEKEIISKDIEKIIAFFNKIQELDITTEEYYYPYHLGETKYNTQLKSEINFEDFIEKNSVREQSYFKIPPILKS
ncbi:MAG: aspartyl/glutamyl-tRNA amidotransferase subunit C [bacterium]